MGTQYVPVTDVYLSGAGDQLCGPEGEGHSRSLLSVLSAVIYCSSGVHSLIHASLTAAVPGDVGVTEEEGEAHPEPVLFRENQFWGFTALRELDLFSN